MKTELGRTPIVVEDAYGTWLWVDERVAQFPVLARRTLGSASPMLLSMRSWRQSKRR
jgi:hypothetical protein